ncbi:hypothetical protein QCA50_006001 [Cerrena zonata]|uniref:Transmembrane protein n=1 Tax=Cerrena zonata TaxID=2478898 RepID=A0AAW0GGQ0_9APHY
MARASFRTLSSVVVALVALAPDTLAQSTNATCLTGFDWMTNSRQQSPCLMAAYLSSPCLTDPSNARVLAIDSDTHYAAPKGVASATPCRCSTVFYSMLQACALCQGAQTIPWSTWASGCNGTTFISEYPRDIPSGTAIPSWSYEDVVKLDNFNLTAAMALDSTNPPESTAGSAPTATGSGVTPSSTSDLSDDGENAQGSSHKSNAGAIAGGVIGGIAGLILIAGGVWWFLRRKQVKKSIPATSPYHIDTQGNWDDKQQQGLLASTPPNQHMYAPQPVPTSQPTGARLYDPNDPSTFPAGGMEPSTLYTAQSPTIYAQNAYGKPGQYHGVAEV